MIALYDVNGYTFAGIKYLMKFKHEQRLLYLYLYFNVDNIGQGILKDTYHHFHLEC